MNYVKDIKLRNEDNSYNMIIEIPKGTRNKYELDEANGNDKVVNVRKVVKKYPFYYGCFPRTLAGDKDPLDVILITKNKHNILDIAKVEFIGVVKTIDNGEIDDKIFAVEKGEDLKKVGKLVTRAIKFLYEYKGKYSNMIIDDEFYDKKEALRLVKNASIMYNKTADRATLKIN